MSTGNVFHDIEITEKEIAMKIIASLQKELKETKSNFNAAMRQMPHVCGNCISHRGGSCDVGETNYLEDCDMWVWDNTVKRKDNNMKDDLINRTTLIPDIGDAEIENGTKMVHYSADCIRNAPTVDAAPEVHAQWVEEFDENGVSWGTYYCSICHGGPGNDSDGKPWLSANCPNCGARMDAEEGAGE